MTITNHSSLTIKSH